MDDSHIYREFSKRLIDIELKLRGNFDGVMNTLENINVTTIGALLNIRQSPIHGAHFRDVADMMHRGILDKWHHYSQDPGSGLVLPDGSFSPTKPKRLQ